MRIIRTRASGFWGKDINTMGTFSYATLDPRNTSVAIEANEKVFASGPVVGIEVTIPALAERCVCNIDPQHTGGAANRAAIEDALTVEVPPEGATLATIRADLDAVGSMAILSMRAKGESLEPAMKRIIMIADADKFARGGWAGPSELPTRKNPWPDSASAGNSRELSGIAMAVADFKVPLVDRVATMEAWLLTGVEPQHYAVYAEHDRLELINTLETGQIKYETCADGRIAVVETAHMAVTMIGYSLAPVVIALNPAYKLGGGESHRKFTVCAYEQRLVNMKAIFTELNLLEPGWGGSPTIGGSPQGVSSALTIEQVVEVVERHLQFDVVFRVEEEITMFLHDEELLHQESVWFGPNAASYCIERGMFFTRFFELNGDDDILWGNAPSNVNGLSQADLKALEEYGMVTLLAGSYTST